MNLIRGLIPRASSATPTVLPLRSPAGLAGCCRHHPAVRPSSLRLSAIGTVGRNPECFVAWHLWPSIWQKQFPWSSVGRRSWTIAMRRWFSRPARGRARPGDLAQGVDMRLVAPLRRRLAPQPVRLGHVAVLAAHREIVGGKVTHGSHSVQKDNTPENKMGRTLKDFGCGSSLKMESCGNRTFTVGVSRTRTLPALWLG
jgi:hypothetical protein